jgi:hypothetical protein
MILMHEMLETCQTSSSPSTANSLCPSKAQGNMKRKLLASTSNASMLPRNPWSYAATAALMHVELRFGRKLEHVEE